MEGAVLIFCGNFFHLKAILTFYNVLYWVWHDWEPDKLSWCKQTKHDISSLLVFFSAPYKTYIIFGIDCFLYEWWHRRMLGGRRSKIWTLKSTPSVSEWYSIKAFLKWTWDLVILFCVISRSLKLWIVNLVCCFQCYIWCFKLASAIAALDALSSQLEI